MLRKTAARWMQFEIFEAADSTGYRSWTGVLSPRRSHSRQEGAFYYVPLQLLIGVCSGLVARPRPRDQRVAGSKPASTEDPPCMGPVAR
ncbi:hypothetical protein AVEN_270307-1 [Araneus ventricosus]|uniref:Uncharacterized protein n=1 Tax=Araneus ventricosus TaxID=182803 RepID=A0A4Y2VSG5_ARAVE|nr:hypothetical protein AVEN_270307-1 [Araneus ventricosus]